MIIGITLVFITIVVCITVMVCVFLSNQDNYSYWNISGDLKEIKRMLEDISEKK